MILLQLLALHALCDFPLQGDFMARAKNHRTPVPGVPWPWVLLAHALIHAGSVSLVVPLWCAVVELSAHFALDYAKNAGWLGSGEKGFSNDQLGHVLCKLVYWGLA